jgi:hypothetical protein
LALRGTGKRIFISIKFLKKEALQCSGKACGHGQVTRKNLRWGHKATNGKMGGGTVSKDRRGCGKTPAKDVVYEH